jgi:hypothetical protein
MSSPGLWPVRYVEVPSGSVSLQGQLRVVNKSGSKPGIAPVVRTHVKVA